MDSGKVHDIFMANCAAMVYVEVELPSGDRSIGSAFHVGDGVFVTARHVLEGDKILEISTTNDIDIPLAGDEVKHANVQVHRGGKVIPSHSIRNGKLELDAGPYYHLHDDVDVAAFKVKTIDPYTPAIQLGGHLDDWIGRGDFVLFEAVVLGYPPIPMSSEPILLATRAEVNACVDLRDTPGVHFILSAMPRGGFSGGVAISEGDYAFGVITRSLTSNHSALELGFMTATGIEPVYECLADHHLLPEAQAAGWDGLWNTIDVHFYDPKRGEQFGKTVVASVDLFDDGKKYALTIMCDESAEVLARSIAMATEALSGYDCTQSQIRPGMLQIEVAARGERTAEDVRIAARAMSAVLMDIGYEPFRFDDEEGLLFA